CDDSYLLADNLRVRQGDKVLDMGTGCGLQGLVASSKSRRGISSDISKRALKCAAHNARRNRVTNIQFIESDLFRNIRGKFDLIAFNPPYLLTDPLEQGDEHARAWDGGKDGLRVISEFIGGVKDHLTPKGRVQMIASSMGGIEATMQLFEEVGLKARIETKKCFSFEELALIDARL
ncbi:MAG: methyltransferase, partial [Candidatus Hydrothermarchaeota archaeon]|nr:methyltransferase [Candidatus Hydrothermarchaeota archaeon]